MDINEYMDLIFLIIPMGLKTDKDVLDHLF